MTEVKVLIKPFEVIEDQIIELAIFQYYAYVDHQFYYDYATLEDLNNRGKFGVRAGDLRLFNIDTNTIENFPIYTKQFVKNTPPNFCITLPDTRPNSKQKYPLDLYEIIHTNYSELDIYEDESSSLIAYKNVHTGQLTYFTRETQSQITTINTYKTYVYGFLPLSIRVNEKVDKQTEHHYEGAMLTVRIYREYFKSRNQKKYHFRRIFKDVEVPIMYDYGYADHPFVKINLNYNSAFDFKELSKSNLLKEVFADEILEDPRQNWID